MGRTKVILAAYAYVKRCVARNVIAPELIDADTQFGCEVNRGAFEFRIKFDRSPPSGIVSSSDKRDRVDLWAFPDDL